MLLVCSDTYPVEMDRRGTKYLLHEHNGKNNAVDAAVTAVATAARVGFTAEVM